MQNWLQHAAHCSFSWVRATRGACQAGFVPFLLTLYSFAIIIANVQELLVDVHFLTSWFSFVPFLLTLHSFAIANTLEEPLVVCNGCWMKNAVHILALLQTSAVHWNVYNKSVKNLIAQLWIGFQTNYNLLFQTSLFSRLRRALGWKWNGERI